MLFKHSGSLDGPGPFCVLYDDNWDDWFKFETKYNLYFVDENGKRYHLGGLKIGRSGLTPRERRAEIADEFSILPEGYFSLGQSEDYYETLSGFPQAVREGILVGLRDIAFGHDLYRANKSELVMTESLLRSVPLTSIFGRFNRLANGDATLSKFHFEIPLRSWPSGGMLSFDVTPESLPPTNVHVLIGRNGVGKTTSLRAFINDIFNRQLTSPDQDGGDEGKNANLSFANLVAIAFSAFDPFIPIPHGAEGINGMRFAYVGLRPPAKSAQESAELPPKGLGELAQEFVESVRVCREGVKADRWLRALEVLESDPLFSDAEIAGLVDGDDERAKAVFLRLSAGHRVVLLAITRLVEYVEERSLVIMDEPEGHLHPPLLSALIRAVSQLLANRNGVAVIATHSPVVLQEVPASCVWMVRRTGDVCKAERPNTETFGESVGVLTREVFGLEVSHSGFHKLISEYIEKNECSYEDVLKAFGGQLGTEAKTLARALTFKAEAAE